MCTALNVIASQVINKPLLASLRPSVRLSVTRSDWSFVVAGVLFIVWFMSCVAVMYKSLVPYIVDIRPVQVVCCTSRFVMRDGVWKGINSDEGRERRRE